MSDPQHPTPTSLNALNALDGARATGVLREICTATAWVAAVRDGRPYPTRESLYRASDEAVARLTPRDLAEAMAGHPPIGRPAPGDPAAAGEQRGMAAAPAGLKARMLELNLAYQEKFGHVFLICATGLTASDLLRAATDRMGHTPRQERETVRTELGGINRIRLARLTDQDTPPVGGRAAPSRAGEKIT